MDDRASRRSLAPTAERGFHSALADLSPERALIVYPGSERYPTASSIEAIGVAELCAEALALSR